MSQSQQLALQVRVFDIFCEILTHSKCDYRFFVKVKKYNKTFLRNFDTHKHIFCTVPRKLTKIDKIELYKQLISDKDRSLCSPKVQIYQDKLMILAGLPLLFAIKSFCC